MLAVGVSLLHTHLYARTHAPEWIIGETEAKRLGSAVSDVLAEYGITASRKVGAWGALAMVSGEIYGSRLVHYVGRTMGAPRENKAPTSHPLAAMMGA